MKFPNLRKFSLKDITGYFHTTKEVHPDENGDLLHAHDVLSAAGIAVVGDGYISEADAEKLKVEDTKPKDEPKPKDKPKAD